MESSSEETTAPKRAPRKRATRSTLRAPQKVAERRAAPKRAPVEPARKEERAAPTLERKAPTPISTTQSVKKRKQKQRIVTAIVILLGIGASAAVGFTDRGQINVQQTIEERNLRVRTNTTDARDLKTSNVEVPVQNTSQKADGGLVGRTPEEMASRKPVELAPVTTATSSEQTASSTDEAATGTEDLTEEQEPVSAETETEPTEEESTLVEDVL